MKASAECLPCVLRQIISTARVAGADEETQRRIVVEGIKVLAEVDLNRSPAEVSFDCMKLTYELLGNDDPYRAQKAEQNRRALAHCERLANAVAESEDPLLTSLKLAAAGNIIDSGIQSGYNLDATLERILARPFGVDDYPLFRERLAVAKTVLYVADNAGEIVFDRLVIERLGEVETTCVVRRSPVINDATRDDARQAGIDRVARVIDPGVDSLGIPLARCPAGFVGEFERADLIISKGQANFETLEEYGSDERFSGKMFFVLMAKCDCVARLLGAKTGDAVLKLACRDGYRHNE